MKDAIIILGGGINKDGNLPKIPKERVEKGVEIWKGGSAKKIIVSGKYGFWLDELKQVPPKTEAAAMRDYALLLGVQAEDVILEEDSKDTIGNAYFVKVNILEKNNWRNIVVVTSDYHLTRTEFIFNLVLGKEYNVEYIPVQHHFTAEDRASREKIEAKTIEVLKHIMGDIEIGDTNAVKNALFDKHPGYAKNPKISLESLKLMLGRGMKV